jgi:IclR family KDG regulon transcriptional repressor
MGKRVPELLTRTVAVLEAFTGEEAELSVGEIVARAGLPPSSAYRLLGQLIELRVVVPGARSGRYRLGPRLIEWGARAQRNLDVRREALPIMEELRDELAETIQLAVRDGLDAVFVETVESRHGLRQHTVVGQRLPLHAGASMRVLLAYAPEAVVEASLNPERLAKIGPHTTTDGAELRRLLDQVRAEGFALSVGEVYADSVALSVPVFSAAGQVAASLTISGPAMRWRPERAMASVPTLQAAAERLSRQVGHAAPSERGAA